jgi:spore germination protein Q
MNPGQQNFPYAIPFSQGNVPPSPLQDPNMGNMPGMFPPSGQPFPNMPQLQQPFNQPQQPFTQPQTTPPYPPSYGYQPPVTSQMTPEFEQSYIENILRLNRGKLGTFYMTYSDSLEWRDRVYRGVIEAAGRDHIIISDPRDGKRYLLLNVYLAWVEFNEEINYEYPIR